jgi:hypothetical protein
MRFSSAYPSPAGASLRLASNVHEPGHAERRVGAQLEWVGEIRIEPAEDHRDACEAAERAQVDMPVAHREIVAFDQLEPEVARQVGVLEVRFVIRAGGEQHRVAAAAGEPGHRLAEVAEERGEPLHAELVEELGKRLADDDAVFERVPEPGRRVAAAREHRPRTVARARQVDRVEVHVHAGRRAHALQRAQELRVPGDELRRDHPVAHQPSLAVDVVQDRVREARALRDGRLDRGPIVGADDERGDVELPLAREPRLLVVDVVGDAVLAHHAHRRFPPLRVLLGRHRRERRGDALPMRPHAAGTIEHLVVPAEGLLAEERCSVGHCVSGAASRACAGSRGSRSPAAA